MVNSLPRQNDFGNTNRLTSGGHRGLACAARAAAPHGSRRCVPGGQPWPSLLRCSSRRTTTASAPSSIDKPKSYQRESSPARAHDTIGAGRVKRLLGARFRRPDSGSFLRAADARFARSVVPSCLSWLPLRRAVRLSCGLIVRHAACPPPPHSSPCPVFYVCSWFLCSFVFHPT